MTSPLETRTPPRALGTAASLLVSRELRWLYHVAFWFMLVAGTALLLVGALMAARVLLRGYFEELPSALAYLTFALLLSVAAFGLRQVRRYFFRVSELAALEIRNAQLVQIGEGDFETFDQVQSLREEKAQADFERNVSDAFLMTSFETGGMGFFGPSTWQFRPGVNLLLGRNGYGKSLVLRTVAALLQRNEDASRDCLIGASDDAFVELRLERNGAPERIRRGRRRFTESAGKIPILAIPDSRFVSRLDIAITPPERDQAVDLRADGARHFLRYEPYGQMMQSLFNELCYDYLEDDSFEAPIFELLTRSIEELTQDRFTFHSVERVGRNAFHLMVLTEGNEEPQPIQFASQGTLSVLGVVGIVYSYLKALGEPRRGERILERPAIVLIDELDAHLHPLWQQKLTGVLRGRFPNVQFVLSAHSPLVVAGCWGSEVSVLRKGERGFVLTQLERDFLGTPVEEIYREIFRVEDVDTSYLRLASRASANFSNRSRIAELERKTAPTELERRELMRLVREESMIMRAAEVKVERHEAQETIAVLEARVEALQDELTRAHGGSDAVRP